MVKAKCTDGSLIFGLSAKNLELLKQDRPIEINCAEMYLDQVPPKIVIFYAETEAAMMELFKQAGTLDESVPIRPHSDG